MVKSVHKIVLTGGPCAGKTTMMNRIVSEFSEKGFKVIVCPEGATELIPNGILPNSNGISMEQYQYLIIQKQLDKEALYDKIVDMMDTGDIIVMYDRGLLDGQCYVTPEFFQKVLDDFKLERMDVMGRYDAIIHLTTAAKTEGLYTTDNNVARSENIEQAIDLDNKVLDSWMGHPHLRVIENFENFDDKIRKALGEIYSLIGEPTPIEIKKRYLVELPSVEDLDRCKAYWSRILQFYLTSDDPSVERRVRRQGSKDTGHIFSYTEKEILSEMACSKRERKITIREYEQYKTEVDTSIPLLVKTRHCFVYKGQYFKLDVYLGQDKAILELELTDKNQNVELPDFIKVIKDVTTDKSYRNKAIAKRGEL